jgi:hypothetical protein
VQPERQELEIGSVACDGGSIVSDRAPLIGQSREKKWLPHGALAQVVKDLFLYPMVKILSLSRLLILPALALLPLPKAGGVNGACLACIRQGRSRILILRGCAMRQRASSSTVELTFCYQQAIRPQAACVL